MNIPAELTSAPVSGTNYTLTAEIDTHDASMTEVGLELVVTYQDEKNKTRIYNVKEFDVTSVNGSTISYSLNYSMGNGGSYKFGVRMFPKNEVLPNRMNFAYVRWI